MWLKWYQLNHWPKQTLWILKLLGNTEQQCKTQTSFPFHSFYWTSNVTQHFGDKSYSTLTTTGLIARETKSAVLMLLSAATKTEITVLHYSFVRNGRLTSSVPTMVATIVVKWAYDLSILCGLALSSIDRNLGITVAVSGLGTDLSAGLLVTGISYHNLITTTTSTPWGGASSAGSSSRHVEGLPRQVVHWVFVITCQEKVLGKTTIAVEHGETRRFSSFGQLCFQTSDLTKRERRERKGK